ncbi:TetR/AcrR family transcriptional regulator [Streptomyces sp. NPDC055037]
MTDDRQPARRGRPPDLVARQRTLDLAGEILRESGYAGLTMDLLVRRAGISKKSLYRWWPNKAAVVAEALAERADVLTVPEDADSRTQLLALARNARHYALTDALPLGTVSRQSDADQQMFARTYIDHIVRPRRALSRTALERVIAAGDLPADTDIDALLDLWSGFAVYRQSVRGVEVTDRLVEQLVDMALAGSVPRTA